LTDCGSIRPAAPTRPAAKPANRDRGYADRKRLFRQHGDGQISVLLSVFLSVMVCFANVSVATPITVNNASFEALVLTCTPGPGCFALFNVPDWVVTGQASTFKPSTGAGREFTSIPNGVNVAAIGDPAGPGSLSQTLAATVQPNTFYTLEVSVGRRADATFSPYTIALTAGSTVLASDSSLRPPPGSFLTDTITFSTGPNPSTLGQSLDIELSATGEQADFDEVLLDATPSASVPEPGTLFLLATSCVGLLGYRRFRVVASAWKPSTRRTDRRFLPAATRLDAWGT
jgi:hypothetical protein